MQRKKEPRGFWLDNIQIEARETDMMMNEAKRQAERWETDLSNAEKKPIFGTITAFW